MNVFGALVEWHWQGAPEIVEEKPVQVPLFPLEIPDGLADIRSHTSAINCLIPVVAVVGLNGKMKYVAAELVGLRSFLVHRNV